MSTRLESTDALTVKALPLCFGAERNKPFQQRSLSFSNSHKDEQRHRVMRFLLKHHRSRAMRYFGLPGLTWTVERDLLRECGPKSRFVGLEYNWSILERSVPWMPGTNPFMFSYPMVIGEFNGYRTSHAQAIFGNLDSFLSVSGTDLSHPRLESTETLRRHRHEKIKWRQRFFSNNAIWLDLTSTVTAASTQRLLRLAFMLCHFKTPHVPIAVTLTYGRERGVRGGLESREKMIAECFGANRYRRYEPVDRWHYESVCGGRMATFCGVFALRH